MPSFLFRLDLNGEGARLTFTEWSTLLASSESGEYRVGYSPGAESTSFTNRGGWPEVRRPLAMLGPTVALLCGDPAVTVGFDHFTLETERHDTQETSPGSPKPAPPSGKWIRDDRRVAAYQAVITDVGVALRFWRTGNHGEHHHDVVDYAVEGAADSEVFTNRGGFIRTGRAITLFEPTLRVLRDSAGVWLNTDGDLTATSPVA